MKSKLLKETATSIASLHLPHPIRVGIDGVSASGKTIFADSLVKPLEDLGRQVIRASLDGFHNPPEIRYKQGEHCPIGYMEDSFNRSAVLEKLLHPLGPNGNLQYTSSLFDFVSNQETRIKLEHAQPDSILIFEGVMLFCDQLSNHFDFRIFIDASFDNILERAKTRDADRLGGEESLLKKYNARYIPGQQAYLDRHTPKNGAHLVVDNNDYHAPVAVTKRPHGMDSRHR